MLKTSPHVLVLVLALLAGCAPDSSSSPSLSSTRSSTSGLSSGPGWGALSMLRPRYEPTTTRLLDGKVLVVGVTQLYFPTTEVEVYDPATSTWGSTGPNLWMRWGHTATLLADGKVLVSGGEGIVLAPNSMRRCMTRPRAPGAPPAP